MHRRKFLTGMASLAVATLPRRVLGGQPKLSVGVVGGGIIGASIAYNLARAGASVTVFEKSTPASGATGKSFAWINAFSDDPHYRELRLRSLHAYRELEKRFELDITWGGSITWAHKPDDVAMLNAFAKEFPLSGYMVQKLDSSEFAALAPNLRPGPFEFALYAPLDGHLDPVRVTQTFLDQASLYGARTFYPCEVSDVDMVGNRLKGIITDRGRFSLDRLVIACGVDTPFLASKVGYVAPLRHAPGILARSTPVPPLTRTVNEGPTVHFKQLPNGILVGADSTYAPDIPAHRDILREPTDFPDEAIRHAHGQRILDKIVDVLPSARDATFEKLTLGLRPMPVDGMPIVGFVPDNSDVYVAVMHSGITLAPIVGDFACREILDDVSISDLAPYRPGRFAAQIGCVCNRSVRQMADDLHIV